MRFIIGAVFGVFDAIFWLCVLGAVILAGYVLLKNLIGF